MSRPEVETTQVCIRGCKRPNIDKESGEIGEPIPRVATDGLLCKKDAENIAKWLDDLCDLYATLDVRIEKAQEREAGGKKTKISGSPSLIRLDVMAMLDPRTRPGEGFPWLDGSREPDDGLWNVYQTIAGWASVLADEKSLDSEYSDLTAAVKLLTAWLPTVYEQPWVDEFYTELRHVHGLLSRALGIPRPKVMGHCLSILGEGSKTHACGQTLYAPVGTSIIRCSNCGRTYNGVEIVKLRAIEMHENGDTVPLRDKAS